MNAVAAVEFLLQLGLQRLVGHVGKGSKRNEALHDVVGHLLLRAARLLVEEKRDGDAGVLADQAHTRHDLNDGEKEGANGGQWDERWVVDVREEESERGGGGFAVQRGEELEDEEERHQRVHAHALLRVR